MLTHWLKKPDFTDLMKKDILRSPVEQILVKKLVEGSIGRNGGSAEVRCGVNCD